MMKKLLAVAAGGAALATIVALAAAGVGAANAAEADGMRSYASRQAITHNFGSKHAVGYFAPQNGACALTMFLVEVEDGYASSPTRIAIMVKAGESALLSSAEGQSLEVKCRQDAAAVEVRPTALTAAAFTTN